MELEEIAESDWLLENLTEQPLDSLSECDPADAHDWASDYPIWLDDVRGWVDAYEL